MSDLLRVHRLSKSFDSVVALDDVSLRLQPGEVVSLIGPSGSGKTTLLRAIAMLEEVDSGLIEFRGKLLGKRVHRGRIVPQRRGVLREQRRGMGFVFQSFNLFPNLTALENVALGPRATLRLGRSTAVGRARTLLEQVGLGDRESHHPAQLSGGQQQRVAIARSLAMAPELLLLDEPTSSLDPELVEEVLHVLRDLTERGQAMLIATHELDFALQAADRVIFMEAGAIVESGPARDVLLSPQTPRLQRFLSAWNGSRERRR